jgi:hypothetical protein
VQSISTGEAAAAGAPAETKAARGSHGQRREEWTGIETSRPAAAGSTQPTKTHPPTRDPPLHQAAPRRAGDSERGEEVSST